MSTNAKPVESLGISDFVANPVWEYANDDELGETIVRPVEQLPVDNLDGRVVGIQVELANGTRVWASIGNVDSKNPRSTEQFLTLSVESGGRWFALSRYHDFNYAERGPQALAQFLALPVAEVFPITYDVTRYAEGDPAALSGKILEEPRERLSRHEIIALAVP
jgi:hypothetical protein